MLHRYLRHNLRNELNIVHGYADLLRAELDEPDRRVETVLATTEKMLTTVDLVRRVSNLIRNEERTLEAVTPETVVEPLDVGQTAVEKAGARITIHAEFATVLEGLVVSLAEHGSAEAITVHGKPVGEQYEIAVRCGFVVPATELSAFDTATEQSATHHPNRLSFWLTKAVVRDAGGYVETACEPGETTIRLCLSMTAAPAAVRA